jgi:hypothetical protein
MLTCGAIAACQGYRARPAVAHLSALQVRFRDESMNQQTTKLEFDTNHRLRRYMLDSVSLDHLRIFIAAADEGSFSAGGRRLRRAQSVISQTLANLEAQLGVKLFDRSSRSPVLID